MYEKIFNEFTSKYDFNDSKIRLKYNHSYRVRNQALKYAIMMNYSEEDIKLAEFIGLYHDIGRFTQLEKYNTYDDSKSIDHAKEGINVLFEEGLINNFSFNEEEKEIIKFAILNHNQYKIDETEKNERKVMHAKLIRDVDKLDIIYLFAYLNDEILKIEDAPIDKDFVKAIKNHKPISKKYVPNYSFIEYLAFAFDINNDIILEEFGKYLNDMYKKYKLDNLFDEVYQIINEYIEKRKNNVRY